MSLLSLNLHQKKILIFSQGSKYGIELQDYLRASGYTVALCDAYDFIINRVMNEDPDLLIVIDAKARDICKEVRKFYQNSILVLTEDDDEFEHVLCLELGADNYVCLNGVSKKIILTRIRAMLATHARLLRLRTEIRSRKPTVLEFNNGLIVINKGNRSVEVAGEYVPFTGQEFNILWILASNYHEVMLREHIFKQLNKEDSTPYDRSIDVIVTRIRKKLQDDPENPKYIKTVRKMGYLFCCAPTSVYEFKNNEELLVLDKNSECSSNK